MLPQAGDLLPQAGNLLLQAGMSSLSSILPALLLEGAAQEGLAVAWVPIQAAFEGKGWQDNWFDPRQQFPWARTIVSFALPYPAPAVPPGLLEGRIAAFAAFDWYGALKEGLRRIAKALREQLPGLRVKVLVEGPLQEKGWAWRSGLGWRGRNTLLFHPTWGSRLLLGELLVSEELEASAPSWVNHSPSERRSAQEGFAGNPAGECGDCRLCLEACPTGALEENERNSIRPSAPFFHLHIERCLDTLTLHHPGSLPDWARSVLGQRLVGCDLCQEVCPFNKVAPRAPFCSSNPPPGPGWKLSIPSSLALEEPRFRSVFTGHALGRLPFARFLRNCLAAAGNSDGAAIAESVRPFLCHPDPILAEQASWSLARLTGQ
ncbi:MAG: 4Fe-4S double cluster binding domain-containing protein [bacterium]